MGLPLELEVVIRRDDELPLPDLTFACESSWITSAFAPAPGGSNSVILTLRLAPTLDDRGPRTLSGIVYATAGDHTPVSVTLNVLARLG